MEDPTTRPVDQTKLLLVELCKSSCLLRAWGAGSQQILWKCLRCVYINLSLSGGSLGGLAKSTKTVEFCKSEEIGLQILILVPGNK